MTAITNAYSAFLTRVAAALSSHVRLSNPYKIEENPSNYLRQGYGIAIGAGENTKRVMNNNLSIRRQFLVTLTRQYYATELNSSNKATTEQQLCEDLRTLLADIHLNQTLNDGSRIAGYESDTGIQYVSADVDNFMYLQAIINIEYFDTLT